MKTSLYGTLQATQCVIIEFHITFSNILCCLLMLFYQPTFSDAQFSSLMSYTLVNERKFFYAYLTVVVSKVHLMVWKIKKQKLLFQTCSLLLGFFIYRNGFEAGRHA